MKKKGFVLAYLLIFTLGTYISLHAFFSSSVMGTPTENLEETGTSVETGTTEQTEELEEEREKLPPEELDEVPESPEILKEPEEIPAVTFERALFIGDSRTVGLMEYGAMEGANFFSDVGMTVYNIHDKVVSVPSVGKVTFNQLLEGKEYDNIYVMLGINELGYSFDQTVGVYDSLIDEIVRKQPGAKLIIQGNLHVTKERSGKDSIINNPAIDKFNNAVRKRADNERTFYLDPNVLFDDGEGNLSEEKTGDQAHIYAKHYKEWAEWIATETGRMLWEADVE